MNSSNNLFASPNDMQALQMNIAQRDQLINQLLEKVASLEVAISNSNAAPQKNEPARKSKKKATVNVIPPDSGTQVQSSTSTKKKATAKSPKTPVNQTKLPKTPVNQRARSATPQTPTSAPKKNPLQMIMKDQPAGFERTKEAFYVHIKLMWGLIGQHSVPNPPDPSLLKEFNERFSETSEIEAVIYGSGSTKLVAENEIQILRDAKEGKLKIGKGMIHITQFFLEYMWGTLAKLGLRIWAPDLDAQLDSLYNEACRMSAIYTFRQAVANKIYAHMSVNPSYIKDIGLLQSAYNHYVHYYMAQIYSKEQKTGGSHAKDEEKKVIQRSRQRLRDYRYKFAVAQDLPKRYQEVLEPIHAHSDDEYFPKKDVYIVKKLPFRSEAATTFIRRLDEEISKFNKSQKKRPQQRRRIRVKNAPLSIFPRAPDGLPLDFYDPQWFNGMLPARKQTLVGDNPTLAFLPNPLRSLTAAAAPDEKLSKKKFTEKFWDKATKDYDLSYQIMEDEDEDSSDESDSTYAGESIDLNETSGGDSSESEEEFEDFVDDNMDEGTSGTARGEESHEVSYIDRPRFSLEQDETMDDVEYNEELYGTSSFAGGLTAEEWNDWQ